MDHLINEIFSSYMRSGDVPDHYFNWTEYMFDAFLAGYDAGLQDGHSLGYYRGQNQNWLTTNYGAETGGH